MNKIMSKEELEENYEKFKELLRKTKRAGIEELLAYIDKTDFKVSPASTTFHRNYIGGLVEHSIEVMELMFKLNTVMNFNLTDEQIIITGLLHDLCKANTFEMYTKNVKNETTGKFEQGQAFRVRDPFPIGHGEKSVIMLQKYIELSDVEIVLIRGHRGPYNTFMDERLYSNMCDVYPEIMLIHTADCMSSRYEVIANVKRKELAQKENE